MCLEPCGINKGRKVLLGYPTIVHTLQAKGCVHYSSKNVSLCGCKNPSIPYRTKRFYEPSTARRSVRKSSSMTVLWRLRSNSPSTVALADSAASSSLKGSISPAPMVREYEFTVLGRPRAGSGLEEMAPASQAWNLAILLV